jgi:hypothetical protein
MAMDLPRLAQLLGNTGWQVSSFTRMAAATATPIRQDALRWSSFPATLSVGCASQDVAACVGRGRAAPASGGRTPPPGETVQARETALQIALLRNGLARWQRLHWRRGRQRLYLRNFRGRNSRVRHNWQDSIRLLVPQPDACLNVGAVGDSRILK